MSHQQSHHHTGLLVKDAPAPEQLRPLRADQNLYLSALLEWLRRLLAWQISLTRQVYGDLAEDPYRGLYIPSAEADILAATAPDLPADLAAERARLAAERAELERQALAGPPPPLYQLAALFGLSPFERDVLLVALAPELDLRFERIFAFIQDDVSRRRPMVDLAIRLLCATPAEAMAAQRCFAHDAPLVREQLVLLFEDGQRRPPLLARFLKLDDRIVALLRGQPAGVDPLIAAWVALSRPTRLLGDLILEPQLAAGLALAARPATAIGLQGGYGSGRRALAEAICAGQGWPLLMVAVDQLLDEASAGQLAPRELLARVVREARLDGAAILWCGVDRVLHEEAQAGGRGALLDAIDGFDGCSFLALDTPWEAHGRLRRARYLSQRLPELSYSQREQIWRARMAERAPAEPALRVLASTFRLSPGQIRDAALMARALAGWRAAEGERPDLAELYAACRAQSSGRLDALAHKIRATYSWDDIVLPVGQVRQLREISMQVRHRRTVLEAWGFDQHLAMGKGVNVLFAGQSGTGKTMAAEIIAADLGLELYKIDLASMVSKYIGETEKNLDKVFSAAREANAILFFDEADAIFGKRSEVKDAHDRYANIEVGYLLQKMESYDGVVILATNLRKNLDEAFVRRLHTTVDFPFPEEADRLRIWRKAFPAAAPLAADTDMSFLARQFKLSGGNIRNAALLAAYLAAEEGGLLGMAQIVRAIGREYQKIGKLATEAEFGSYLSLLRH